MFKRIFRALFVDHLRLHREGPQLRLGLGEAAAAVVAETPTQAMRRGLSTLLDSHPGSRTGFKHLAALEHSLATKQGPFIHDLSQSALQTLLRQLQGLIEPPAAPEVQRLLAELLDAAELQARLEEQRAHSQPISSFFVDHKLEVQELTSPSSELLADFATTAGTAAAAAERDLA